MNCGAMPGSFRCRRPPCGKVIHMTSSSPKKPQITALIRSRSEWRRGRLAVGGLCAALVAGAGLLLVGRGNGAATPVPILAPTSVSSPAPQTPEESELVVFPERPEIEAPAELLTAGILLVSGASNSAADAPAAEIVLAAGTSLEGVGDNDRGIILVSAGSTEADAVIEPAIDLSEVPVIALADEPAPPNPLRDRDRGQAGSAAGCCPEGSLRRGVEGLPRCPPVPP